MSIFPYLLAAGCALVIYRFIDRGWSSWRDLGVMWILCFTAIVLVATARDALRWGLVSAPAVALFFSLLLRQVPRRIPPPETERIKSSPPRNHAILEMLQIATAGVSSVILLLDASSVPTPGIVFAAVSYALVVAEALSRLSRRIPPARAS